VGSSLGSGSSDVSTDGDSLGSSDGVTSSVGSSWGRSGLSGVSSRPPLSRIPGTVAPVSRSEPPVYAETARPVTSSKLVIAIIATTKTAPAIRAIRFHGSRFAISKALAGSEGGSSPGSAVPSPVSDASCNACSASSKARSARWSGVSAPVSPRSRAADASSIWLRAVVTRRRAAAWAATCWRLTSSVRL
jgi:hypothetical protein